MTAQPFAFDEYCTRVGVESTGATTVDRLEALQRAQSYSIPFENFDIQLGRGIDLDPEHVFVKLVRSKRGGYCFELNGLFLRAIRAAGSDARTLLARVHVGPVPSGRSHQISLVELGGRRWIVDVGFGGMCPRMPLPLELDTETVHDGSVFRLRGHELGHLLQVKTQSGWLDLYSFDLTPVVANDIVYGNHYTSTHPESFFTTSRIASLAHPEGRTALFNFRCTTIRNGDESHVELPDDARYLSELKRLFGIELQTGYEGLAPLGAVEG
jgi:N-hydroxyarylamine O-acetyltransferase